MQAEWVVLKFGGTSVAGRVQWDVIANLAGDRRDRGCRVLLVCSALAGVTTELSALAGDPASSERIDAICRRHERLATELGVDASRWIDEAAQRMHANLAQLAGGDVAPARADLLAVGEWLGTRIGAEYLQRRLAVSWVDAREALVARDEPELSEARRWLAASCAPGPDAALAERWQALEPIVITQGYVARNAAGQTVLLGRGGSDTSAALFAGRLQSGEVEIWTDVPGFFSADPRQVPEARQLERLDYAEALEMAASGARVMHPAAIGVAEATRTRVWVRDTSRPWLAGTLIGPPAEAAPGVKAIACQRDMVVLLLQKRDTRREVGFLARVFEIVRRHGISVDLVATSETTTTIAINAPANHVDAAGLARLVRELESQCTVKVYEHCVCVNLVGSGVRTALARMAGAMEFFRDHPLLMMSQSANDLCLSLLLEARDHEELLRRAHAALVTSMPDAESPGFGPSWRELAAT